MRSAECQWSSGSGAQQRDARNFRELVKVSGREMNSIRCFQLILGAKRPSALSDDKVNFKSRSQPAVNAVGQSHTCTLEEVVTGHYTP